MKILIVSGFFPPHAPQGGTRINSFAKYIQSRGHDVRVIAALDTRFPPLLSPGISPDRIIYAPFSPPSLRRRNQESRKVGKGATAISDQVARPQAGHPRSRLHRFLGETHDKLINLPDRHIWWRGNAIAAGRALMEHWRPDIIYASAPPHSGLLVAASLSREFPTPWIAEFRDLWVDHPYYDEPVWRRLIEKPLERRVLKSCAGFITVTESWAEHLRIVTAKPVALVLNGFDPDDYPANPDAGPKTGAKLTILYAGALYQTKRDPRMLFDAMRRLGELSHSVNTIFYVKEVELVSRLAREFSVEHCVEVRGMVPRGEVIEAQRHADILLLLRWDDPREDGVIAGKLFEYIGAGRPILSVGSVRGEAADMIRDHGLGVVSSDPETIAHQLKVWLELRQGGQYLPAIPDRVRARFSRVVQFRKLEQFLASRISASVVQC
ncbi:MAG: glycosyltransferase family 4 protein [Sphingomonadales bacterium]